MYSYKKKIMDMNTLKELTEASQTVAIAAWAGVASYMHKIYTKKQAYTALGLASEVITASLAGYLAMNACNYFNVDQSAAGAIVGTAGWAGHRALAFAEEKIKKIANSVFK
jgi:LydA holin phage, holin superfamily III